MAETEEGDNPEKKEVVAKKYVPPFDDWAWPRLKDLVLEDRVKEEITKILFTIEHPTVYEMAGVKPHKSFLFNGPPGVGKTFSVKGIRNELVQSGFPVYWSPYDTGTYGTAYINMGSRIIQQYFDAAREAANKGRIVLSFWDEADVIFANRNDSRNSHAEDRKNLETIMKNMNDINQHGDNIYVFMCTNFPEQMDPAAMRAGRVDKIVNFPLPNAQGRIEGFKYYFDRVNEKAIYEVCKVRKLSALADVSEGFNFADIQAIVDTAVRDKLYDFVNMESTDIASPPSVRLNDLLTTIKEYKKNRSFVGVNYKKNRIGFV